MAFLAPLAEMAGSAALSKLGTTLGPKVLKLAEDKLGKKTLDVLLPHAQAMAYKALPHVKSGFKKLANRLFEHAKKTSPGKLFGKVLGAVPEEHLKTVNDMISEKIKQKLPSSEGEMIGGLRGGEKEMMSEE